MLEKIRNSLSLTFDELVHKTTWPTWAELQNSAIVTLVACLIIAIIVFAMDTIFDNFFKYVVYTLIK